MMVPLLFKSGSLGRLFVTRRYTGIEEPLEFQLIYSNDKIGKFNRSIPYCLLRIQYISVFKTI